MVEGVPKRLIPVLVDGDFGVPNKDVVPVDGFGDEKLNAEVVVVGAGVDPALVVLLVPPKRLVDVVVGVEGVVAPNENPPVLGAVVEVALLPRTVVAPQVTAIFKYNFDYHL